MVFDGALLTEEAQARLCEAVRSAYSSAARQPGGTHPFPVGRELAVSLGYPRELLDSIPSVAVEAFAGVSNVAVVAAIPAGARVLDLGCGAGLDALITAGRVGARGRVLGVDFSEAMLARAHAAVAEAGARNLDVCRAEAERLPVRDGSIDVALVNGIFNLNPARAAILSELARVVRPAGAVFVAELILREPLPPTTRFSQADWFA